MQNAIKQSKTDIFDKNTGLNGGKSGKGHTELL